MSLYSTAMRMIRQYMIDATNIHNQYSSSLSDLDPYKGSVYYDSKSADLMSGETEAIESIRRQNKRELAHIINDMRANVVKRATKNPSQDMAAALTIMNQLDDVSVTMIRMYADAMSECPLAMQMLQQIGQKHNITINVPDVEQMSHSVDVLEYNFNAAMSYDGTTDKVQPTLDTLRQYFQPDDAYLDMPDVKTVDAANDAFWSKYVQCGSPAMLEDPKTATVPVTAYHVFADLDGLLKYIDAKTTGMADAERDSKVNEILSECPDNYGAVYRNYLANGEKLAFSGSDGATEE